MRMFAFAGAALALAAPALGQAPDFQALLSGKDTPTALKLKDLSADWKRVTITNPDNPQGGSDPMKQMMQAGMLSGARGQDAMMGMAMLGGLFGGGGEAPVYYTRGQTVTVGGETFLVAYRFEKPEPNLPLLMAEAGKAGKEPDLAKLAEQAKMTPESPLTLSLVNVKSIGTLGGIRPFDMAREIADSAGAGSMWDLMLMRSAPRTATTPAAEVAQPVAKPVPARPTPTRPQTRPKR